MRKGGLPAFPRSTFVIVLWTLTSYKLYPQSDVCNLIIKLYNHNCPKHFVKQRMPKRTLGCSLTFTRITSSNSARMMSSLALFNRCYFCCSMKRPGIE